MTQTAARVKARAGRDSLAPVPLTTAQLRRIVADRRARLAGLGRPQADLPAGLGRRGLASEARRLFRVLASIPEGAR